MIPPRESVRLADLAYQPFTIAQRAAGDLGFAVRGYFDLPPSQGYLFEREDAAALVFRGTEASRFSILDIASNIRVLARRWEGPGRAHLGYARQYRGIRAAALELAEKVSSEKPLVVCGHSMGGAMAVISAADVFGRGWKFAALVTYGAPKALNMAAARAIRCPIHRYVNRGDFAPHWPPSPNLIHPAPKTQISSGGWPGPLTRHAPSKYILAIDRMEGDKT